MKKITSEVAPVRPMEQLVQQLQPRPQAMGKRKTSRNPFSTSMILSGPDCLLVAVLRML